MGDFGGVQSRNMFDVLNQPTKSKDSKDKPAPKHEAREAKKAAAKAQQAAAAPAHAPEKVRTGNKRGGLANKGTRPASSGRGGATVDSRGKRYQDRKSAADYTKNQGGASKGGFGFGGVTDVAAEARDAAEVHNATGATDVTAAATDAAAAKDADGKEIKADVKEEVPDKTKSFAEYQKELEKLAPKGDIKEARKPIVGKEFKAGAAPAKKKGIQESFMKPEEAPKEEKKQEKKEKKQEKPEKKEKKEKAGKEKPKAAKPVKKVLALDAFNGPVAEPRLALPPKPAGPRPAPAGAATAAAAPAAGAAAGATGAAPAAAAGTAASAAPAAAAGTAAPAGGRGNRGGPRPGSGNRGGRPNRGPRGPVLDFGSAFPPLSPSAAKA